MDFLELEIYNKVFMSSSIIETTLQQTNHCSTLIFILFKEIQMKFNACGTCDVLLSCPRATTPENINPSTLT